MARMTAAQRYSARKLRQRLRAEELALEVERMRAWDNRWGLIDRSINAWAMTAETRNAWVEHVRRGVV